MTAKDVLLGNMDLCMSVLNTYVSDLSDADLLRRPAPRANHLAWQLGHLIQSENFLMNSLSPGSMPALPAGFAEQHNQAAAESDDPARFLTKQQYMKLFKQQREATRKVVAGIDEADLDKPGPERMRRICPTIGSFLILVGNHPMMHAGQFATVRRLLDKPVLI